MVTTRSMAKFKPGQLDVAEDLTEPPSGAHASGHHRGRARKIPPSEFSDPALCRMLPTPSQSAVDKEHLILLQLRALAVAACVLGASAAVGLVSVLLFWWLLIPGWICAEFLFVPYYMYCYHRLNRLPQPHMPRPRHEDDEPMAVWQRFTSHKDKISR